MCSVSRAGMARRMNALDAVAQARRLFDARPGLRPHVEK